MNKAEFEFRAGMARHVEGQTKAAADLEAYRVKVFDRTLTADEQRAMARDIADPVISEALRRESWRTAGASEKMTPAQGWPEFGSPEKQWKESIMTTLADCDELDKWDAPWRVRARARRRTTVARR